MAPIEGGTYAFVAEGMLASGQISILRVLAFLDSCNVFSSDLGVFL